MMLRLFSVATLSALSATSVLGHGYVSKPLPRGPSFLPSTPPHLPSFLHYLPYSFLPSFLPSLTYPIPSFHSSFTFVPAQTIEGHPLRFEPQSDGTRDGVCRDGGEVRRCRTGCLALYTCGVHIFLALHCRLAPSLRRTLKGRR
jgi:hypothetical protein